MNATTNIPQHADRCISAFAKLGRYLGDAASMLEQKIPANDRGSHAQFLYREALKASGRNPWFTGKGIARAFSALSAMLSGDALMEWAGQYRGLYTLPRRTETVLVVMAGNIPLVGFHDMLCVLMAGHHFLGKMASQDNVLPLAIAEVIADLDPELGRRIRFTRQAAGTGAGAVIATGSNNTARYFDHFFGSVPHIIRRNRNGAALLTGRETDTDLRLLADDVFAYYGLGCRNISFLLLPVTFSLSRLEDAWGHHACLNDNPKYRNNYTYRKALLKACNIPHADCGFFHLAEKADPVSPISVIHYSRYNEPKEATKCLSGMAASLQCVVSHRRQKARGWQTVFPGQAQRPGLSDYADGKDTMQFLLTLQ